MRTLFALALVAVVLALASAQTLTPEQRQLISEKYGQDGTAKTVRDALPRVYGPKMDPANVQHWSADEQKDYGIQIGAFTAPGLFFLLFTILGFPLFCCFRYCCNCCCGCRDARRGGYTDGEKWKPYIALAVMGAGLIAFGISGYVFSEKLDNALVGEGSSPGMAPALLNLFDDALGMITYLNTSLGTLVDGTQPVVDDANNRLDATAQAVLNLGTQGLIDRLNRFSHNINNLTITVTADPRSEGLVPNITYPCDYCRNAADGLSATADQVKETSDDTFRQLNDTVKDVKALLIDGQDQLKEYAGDAYVQVVDARKQVSDIRQNAVDLLDDWVKPTESQRRSAVLGLYCLPLLTAVTIVLGGVFKTSGHPFTFTCGLTWLTFLLMSLLLVVHLPIAILFADSCLIIEYAQENVADFANEDAAKFVDTCLVNGSLTDAYNLTDKLSLGDLNFPELPNIADVFANFTLIDQTNAEVQALTLETFGYDPANIYLFVDRLNVHTATYEVPHFNYTRYNVSLCDENLAPTSSARTQTVVLKYSAMSYIDAETQLQGVLNDTKRNMTDIVQYVDQLMVNVSTVQDSLKDVQSLADPLIATAKDLARGVTCGFVGDAYLDVKSRYCGDVVASVSVMSFMCFLILVFSIPVLVISVILSTRFPAKQAVIGPDGKIVDDGTDTADPHATTGGSAALPMSTLQTTKFAADGSIIVEGAMAAPATGAAPPPSGSHASTNSVVLDVPQSAPPVMTQKAFDAAPAYVPPPQSAAAGVTVPNYQTYATPNTQAPLPSYDPNSGAAGAPPPPPPEASAPVYSGYAPSEYGGAPAYVPNASGVAPNYGAAAPQDQYIPGALPATPLPAPSAPVDGAQ